MFDYPGATFDIIGTPDRERSIAAAERYELEQALREADRRARAERRAQRKASRSAANVRRLVPTPSHW